MTHSDTQTAMADQAAAMRQEADDAIERAEIDEILGYKSTAAMLREKAAALRANADRLEKRTEEHIAMLPSISKHNGMAMPSTTPPPPSAVGSGGE